MPLPKPHPEESEDDFIGRCMGDPVMVDEYPDAEQRAGVCQSQWDGPKASGRRPGHEWRLSTPLRALPPEHVDAGKGILSGVAIVTEGEAQTHGFWLDREFVEATIAHGNQKTQGVKARFGHPNMSSTALGTFLGRAKNFRMDDSGQAAIARADLFLSKEAKDTPNGDLFGYVTRMAENEPDVFGISIVFEESGFYRRNEDGSKIYPDYGGKEQWPGWDGKDAREFAELAKLHAADCVDDPAANPDGMFSAWSAAQLAGQVTTFLDEHPEVLRLLAEHPEVLDEFLARYRAYRERKEGVMPAEKAMDAEPMRPPEQAPEKLEAPAAESAAPEPAAESKPSKPEVQEAPGQKFLDAFGDQGGIWFAQGKGFEEAGELYLAKLKSQIAELEQKLKARDAEIASLTARLAEARRDVGLDAASPLKPSAEASPESEEIGRVVKQLLGARNPQTGRRYAEEEARQKAAEIVAERHKKKD